MNWAAFEQQAPDFGRAGRHRLIGADGVAIAFLGTVSDAGAPRLAPVCPIFCNDDLYLSAGSGTPKVRDLRARGRYVLHAFLGENDEEFQISGTCSEVVDEEERSKVHGAILFEAFNRDDPIFRLSIDRALWVFWERVGQPDTKATRRRWRSHEGA